MAKKVSRNDPCPCGSGKKFKNCCYGKGIDWSQRQQASRPQFVVPPPQEAGLSFLGVYVRVDRKLQEIARAHPGEVPWKRQVQRLSESTPLEDRMRIYQAVREAGVIPEEASDFLIWHAVQWMPGLLPPGAGESEDEEDDQVEDPREVEHTQTLLRRYGGDALANLYANHRLEYDRRHERGRQFFYGPPDEMLAQTLKEKGIID